MDYLCDNCNKIKNNTEFKLIGKIKNICIICDEIRKKLWNKNYYESVKNTEKFQKRDIDYRNARKKDKKEYDKEYRKNNKDKYKKYRDANREKIQFLERERAKNNINIKLRKCISNNIRHHINKNRSSCLKYLPYSVEELKQHLESLFEPWMNWSNKGQYFVNLWDDNDQSTWRWSIDHIIPHSLFNYTSMEDEEFKKCWALSNLRPLSAKQNLIDGVTKIRHKAVEQTESK